MSADSPGYGIAPPDYRLPGETRLGPVRLQIADLQRSLDWYQGVLGLRVLDQSDGSASLGVPASEEPLVELNEKTGASPAPRGGQPGLYHFAILLPDRVHLGALLRHLAESDVRAGASDHLVSEAIYLQDPDNLGIEVYADRLRATWRVASNQLAMATDPLDVHDLLRVSDGVRWEGMPAGTVMGHVHLHVGDIDVSARFYHEGIGFDKMVWSYPGALFLAAGGYHHHLGNNTWAAKRQPAADGDARLLEWTIVVPAASDVDGVMQSLGRSGLSAARDGSDVIATDAWGTRVRITANN